MERTDAKQARMRCDVLLGRSRHGPLVGTIEMGTSKKVIG